MKELDSMDGAGTNSVKATGRRVGLLAGAGRFPISFAEAARKQGHHVYGVGVMGMADAGTSRDLPFVCGGSAGSNRTRDHVV